MAKTILGLTIVAAFVAGTITTGIVAYAAQDEGNGPFARILMTLEKMQHQINNLQGNAGQVKYYEVKVPITVDENGHFEATARCDSGDIALHIIDEKDQLIIEEENRSNGMQLFFTGKLKVTGDTALATKLQCLLSLKD